MSQLRQLAAIMFTDIANYTAIMAEDEALAFDLLNQNRKAHQPIIKEYNGQLIKELGDGILASFPTASEAVFAATAIQKATLNIAHLQLRIGIHLGEVVFDNNDVFGDGVNIASRLQTVAPVGGIYISEPVYINIINKKNIKTRYVRREVLKHVKEPVNIYEIITNKNFEETPVIAGNEKYNTEARRSIAILPFVDMSATKDQEYLGDGLAEELINVLTQTKELKVIGRTSSFSFKKKDMDLHTIARTLNVETILEGSVQRSGNRLRITAQLINANDSFHIWSKRYDREMDDIFAVQDDITSKIAENLKITFFGEQHLKEQNKPTENTEAYEMFLRGKFFLDKRIEGYLKAEEYFKSAITLDPMYLDAHYYLGVTYLSMSMYSVIPWKEGIIEARECAENAKSIDEKYPEAHILMAYIHLMQDWTWNLAIQEYNKAKSYSGKDFFTNDIYSFYSWYRGFIYGDFKAAIKECYRHIESDPLSIQNLMTLGQMYFYNHQYAEARKEWQKILEQSPDHSETFRYIGFSYCQEKDMPNAMVYLKKAVEASKGKGWSIIMMIRGLCIAGKKEEANHLVEMIKNSPDKDKVPAFIWCLVYSHIGDLDVAFSFLDKAFEDHDFWLFTLKYGAEWDHIRSDARFEKYVERLNYPAPQP